ncbi:MAG: DNA-binding response regulator [Candidatus Neomarinimicrobiota bacterium]|nr:MAG: DNA-binding response regulator [Candidatus Neomarinimicrobiota bacterium]
MKRVRILLADDHAIVRDGLQALLHSRPGYQVVGQADTGQEAIALAGKLRPDVIIMDIHMPGMDGIEAVRTIRSFSLKTRIIMLSMYSDPLYVRQALRLGANGYLLKQAAAAGLLEAVDCVLSGKKYLSPELETDAEILSGISHLTPREQETLKYIARGLKGKEIASALGVSVNTAKSYRTRLMNKLGLHDIASLTRFALEHDLT